MSRLPTHPRLRDQPLTWDAHLALLDRQVRDSDGRAVSCVADLALTPWCPGDPPPRVEHLIVGSGLWPRLLRMPASPHAPAPRIPWRLVHEVGTTIRLSARSEDLEVTWVRQWLSAQVVGRIWGAT